MLVLADGDAVAFGQTRAHAVRAGFALAPQGADAKAVGGDFFGERNRRNLMDDHATRIGQHHREFGIGQLLIKRGHFELRARDQIAHCLATRT